MKAPRVSVVDYGIVNLHSVVKALRHEGGEVSVITDPRDLGEADRLVLPGVGAFADGMRGLTERSLVGPLRAYAATGRPFLGICLGMQLLFEESEEFGSTPGLSLIPGRVVEIRREANAKVPQIGWNSIFPAPDADWDGTLLGAVPPGAMMYFVHSFTAVPQDEGHRLADSIYAAQRISAAVHRENIWGCQFHPEKSGPVGLAVLRDFLAT